MRRPHGEGHRPRIGRSAGVGLLIGLGLLAPAACSAGSGSDPAGRTSVPTESAGAAAATGPVPAGFEPITGTALRFALPASPVFTADATTVTEDGQLVRRWRHAITPKGPFCLVETVEQAHFAGAFPASVVELFAAGEQLDQHTLLNRVMTPAPPGTLGGVDQESTFTGRLDDGTPFPAHFYQRKYLTAGHTLITLVAAGPQDHSEQCRLPSIIAGLAATGQEFAGAAPDPSPTRRPTGPPPTAGAVQPAT